MIEFEDIVRAADKAEVKDVDGSAFSDHDVLNLILQRSEIIRDQNIAKKSPVIAAWLQGDSAPGYALIEKMGDDLVRRAAAVTWLEYQEIRPTLKELAPKSVADIGCGYGMFDLLFWRDFPGRILLIDIETSDDRHFGFAKTGSAYSDLDVARAFLTSNGVKAKDIMCVNPDKEDLTKQKPVDLAVSFLSCGYHYPASTYRTFFKDQVSKTGSVIIDVRRKNTATELEELGALGSTEELTKVANGTGRRILVRKGK